jgi:large subunit ribosomal protein L6
MATAILRRPALLAGPSSRSFHSSPIAQSHVGSAPIPVPSSVTCTRTPTSFTVAGPKGSQTLPIPPYLQIEESSPLKISVLDPKVRRQRAEWGLFRALISNAVKGVSDGWEVEIKLVGVGYRFLTAPGVIQARLGYPKTLEWKLPEGVTVDLKAPTECVLKGIDKQVSSHATPVGPSYLHNSTRRSFRFWGNLPQAYGIGGSQSLTTAKVSSSTGKRYVGKWPARNRE